LIKNRDEETKAKHIAIFEGEARIGEILSGLQSIQLRPEDLASPIALQMALSRIYESLMRALQEGFKKKYVAEVSFTDNLGNKIVFGVDLGEKLPPFSSNKVKARILVEIVEENEE